MSGTAPAAARAAVEIAAATGPAGPMELAARLGHDFANPALLVEALTHPSALVRGNGREHGRRRKRASPIRGYDRLEFLGDRVLGLVIADLLWRRYPDEPEGSLTRRHTHLVRRETLARVAAEIGLGLHLILSPAETAAGAAANRGILADACEAVLAAIYLDGGFAAAADCIGRLWGPLIAEIEEPPRDPKTALQEWAQARGKGLPHYELVATEGPDHAPVFTITASIAGSLGATATASSKRSAEAAAAAALLDRLEGDATTRTS
jgi:ribonuclease-3